MGRNLAKCLQNIAVAVSLTFVLFGTFQAQAYVVGQSCGQLFDQTGDVIAYIADLSQNQKLSTEQMSRLYEALKNEDKFINPYTKQDAIAADAFIHWQKFEELIRDGVIDKKKLGEWLKERLKERARVGVERDGAKDDTRDSHVKTEFYPIQRGEFMMGSRVYGFKPVSLTHSFEMMSAPVTQKQWVEKMGSNPSLYVKGQHTMEITVNGERIRLQPDNPVERMTWWSALVYANRFSEQMGLKPAYDLSRIRFAKGTSAERGTLRPRTEQEGLKLVINAPNGDIYQAEGFRLPTEAEYEFALRNRGLSQTNNVHDLNESGLGDYAVFGLSSPKVHPSMRVTRPVDEKLPLFIDENKFYGLIGNVYIWTHDFYSSSVSGGVNPQGPKQAPLGKMWRVIRGGHLYSQGKEVIDAHSRGPDSPDYPSQCVGLRLVRTLK